MLEDLNIWLDYFKRNAGSDPHVPWREREVLSGVEKRRISRSIATFQLGENSEGRHLQKLADEFGASWARPELGDITRYFIKEEQNHAALLGRFMNTHGIALKSKEWTDGVFTKLRHLASYSVTLSVLITAELIALVYYRALHLQSGSIVLRCICQKILCDERAHVEFESSILRRFHRQESWFKSEILRQGHRVLYAGATVVVGLAHRRVLKAGGYSFLAFWRACWNEYHTYLGRERLPKQRSSVINYSPRSQPQT